MQRKLYGRHCKQPNIGVYLRVLRPSPRTRGGAENTEKGPGAAVPLYALRSCLKSPKKTCQVRSGRPASHEKSPSAAPVRSGVRAWTFEHPERRALARWLYKASISKH
jgi:hypothetical protein